MLCHTGQNGCVHDTGVGEGIVSNSLPSEREWRRERQQKRKRERAGRKTGRALLGRLYRQATPRARNPTLNTRFQVRGD